jgi:hypothetical protein
VSMTYLEKPEGVIVKLHGREAAPFATAAARVAIASRPRGDLGT